MSQVAIYNKTTEIIMRYARKNGMTYFQVARPVLNILDKRGIHHGMPMYATARLMVLRDVLQVLSPSE